MSDGAGSQSQHYGSPPPTAVRHFTSGLRYGVGTSKRKLDDPDEAALVQDHKDVGLNEGQNCDDCEDCDPSVGSRSNDCDCDRSRSHQATDMPVDSSYAYVVTIEGALVCWGNDSVGQASPP